MTQGYVKFRSALKARDLYGAFEAAKALPGLLSLLDALELTLLAAEKGDRSYDEYAARWVARVTVEKQLNLSEMLWAGDQLQQAPDGEIGTIFGRLATLTT